jgi:metallo-beta-lactamase family protein
MQLQFLGANRQVTGSRYCVTAGKATFLIDCGMFQERAFLSRNWEKCPMPPPQIDALLLTHAHVDHCGLLPKLVRDGFRGHIYATAPTVDLAEIVLRDSAEIQAEDAAQKKLRHAKEGRRPDHPEVPLFTEQDVDRTLRLFRAVSYNKPFELSRGVAATYRDAGHILGSAMIEVMVREANGATAAADRETRIVFSGDIGQWNRPLLNDPSVVSEADYIIMESTYGDRDHPDEGDIGLRLAEIINETASRGGKVVIPTFAVERAQELMFYLARLAHAGKTPQLPIFLDSPMAVDAMRVFARHRSYFDADTWNLINAGQAPLEFPGLHLTHSVEESKAINRLAGPAVIMATSGMCTGGRIKHHLRQNLPRPEATILFVGYQSEGTLGRQILRGDREVRIHGRLWPVRAKVAQISGLSAHADRSGLFRWLSHLRRPPRQLFLTHGEESVALRLADDLRKERGWNVSVPEYLEAINLD